MTDTPKPDPLKVFEDWCANRDDGDLEGLYAVRQDIRSALKARRVFDRILICLAASVAAIVAVAVIICAGS